MALLLIEIEISDHSGLEECNDIFCRLVYAPYPDSGRTAMFIGLITAYIGSYLDILNVYLLSQYISHRRKSILNQKICEARE